MLRHHDIDGVSVPFTAEEETARDAEEVAWKEEGPARAMATLRTERNTLLTESDWTQGADSPLTDEVKAKWAADREELRDLPEDVEDPADPTWPEVPE